MVKNFFEGPNGEGPSTEEEGAAYAAMLNQAVQKMLRKQELPPETVIVEAVPMTAQQPPFDGSKTPTSSSSALRLFEPDTERITVES